MSSILAGLIFGFIGWQFWKLGRRESHVASLCFGVTLMVYPYFVSNDYYLWGIGILLTFLGYRAAKGA